MKKYNLKTAYIKDKNKYLNQIHKFTKDSLQILAVKLISIKELEAKKLLDLDIEKNKEFYVYLLDELKKSDINPNEYLFLENNPSYIICSSSRRNFNDSNNREHISYMPVSDSAIRISSIFGTPFTHPAVMFRKEIV